MIEAEMNLVITVVTSLIGIIIAFSIANMSLAYRSLLQLFLSENKEKERIIKKWASGIQEYLKKEIKWMLGGLIIILFLIVSYLIEDCVFLYGMLVLSFVWIFLYVITTYSRQQKELNILKNQEIKLKIIIIQMDMNKIKIILEVVFWISFWVLIFSLFGGTSLYEISIFIISIIFVRIGILVKRNKKLSPHQKLNLFFTLVIAFFTIMQVWEAMYEKLPRVYTPGIICQDYLLLTPEGYGNFYVSFGNYGELPAWLFLNFQNTTNSLSPIGSSKFTIVLIPVTFQNNQQTQVTFSFRANTTEQTIGFKLKYIIYGDDLIDRSSASYKILLNLFNEVTCRYTKINNTTYYISK
jgi:hypothetical protein